MLKSQDFAPNIKDVISTMNIICGTLTLTLNLYLIFLCVYLIQNGTTDTYRLPLVVDAKHPTESSSDVDYTLPSDLPTYNLNDLPSECINNLVMDKDGYVEASPTTGVAEGYYVCTYSIPSKQREHLNGVIVMLAFHYILGYALKLEIPLYIKGLGLYKRLLYALDTVSSNASLAIDRLYDLGFYIIQRRVYAHLCALLILILLQHL